MNDLSKLMDLLGKIQYDYSFEKDGEFITVDISKDGNNVDGYMGFVCTFMFDNKGNIKGIQIYE